jgi:hypothetical protein
MFKLFAVTLAALCIFQARAACPIMDATNFCIVSTSTYWITNGTLGSFQKISVDLSPNVTYRVFLDSGDFSANPFVLATANDRLANYTNGLIFWNVTRDANTPYPFNLNLPTNGSVVYAFNFTMPTWTMYYASLATVNYGAGLGGSGQAPFLPSPFAQPTVMGTGTANTGTSGSTAGTSTGTAKANSAAVTMSVSAVLVAALPALAWIFA